MFAWIHSEDVADELPSLPEDLLTRDLKQTLEAVRWRRRWPRGNWVETASSWREIRILSFRRSGGERRLFCFHFQWSNLTLFVDFTSIMATFREVRDLLAIACFEDMHRQVCISVVVGSTHVEKSRLSLRRLRTIWPGRDRRFRLFGRV